MGSRWHSLSTASSVPPLLGVSWKTFPLFYKRGPIWLHHFVTLYAQFYSSYFTLLLFFVLHCCSSPCFATPFHVSLLLLPMLQCSSLCFNSLLRVLLLLFMLHCDVPPHDLMFLSVPCCSFSCFVVPFCASLHSSSPCFDVLLCVSLLLFLFVVPFYASLRYSSPCFVVPCVSLFLLLRWYSSCFVASTCFIAFPISLLLIVFRFATLTSFFLLLLCYYSSCFTTSPTLLLLCVIAALIASCFATPPCFIALLLSQVPFYTLLFHYSSVFDYSLA